MIIDVKLVEQKIRLMMNIGARPLPDEFLEVRSGWLNRWLNPLGHRTSLVESER